MHNKEPNPASAKEKAEGSRENTNGEPARQDPNRDPEKAGLHGKNDSGPEPEVHDRDIAGE